MVTMAMDRLMIMISSRLICVLAVDLPRMKYYKRDTVEIISIFRRDIISPIIFVAIRFIILIRYEFAEFILNIRSWQS